MGALCEWCRRGALENNCDPDSISTPGFNTQLFAVWRAAGEVIADEAMAEIIDTEPADYDAHRIERNIDDQDERGTGFDRASWVDQGNRAHTRAYWLNPTGFDRGGAR